MTSKAGEECRCFLLVGAHAASLLQLPWLVAKDRALLNEARGVRSDGPQRCGFAFSYSWLRVMA